MQMTLLQENEQHHSATLEKKLIPDKDFQSIFIRELNQIKQVKADDFGRKGKWKVNIRENIVLYDNDELIVIKVISKEKMILFTNNGIKNVIDLKENLTSKIGKKFSEEA